MPKPRKPKKNGGGKGGPALIPQKHGGALLAGGQPGQTPGPGRPPSALRDQLRGSFGDRIAVLEKVADGQVVQNAEIPLSTILAHARCPKCGDKLEALDEAEILTVSLRGEVSASVGDRVKALDVMAKYGLGAVKEITAENVRDRLRETIDIIRERFAEAETPDELLDYIQPVWK